MAASVHLYQPGPFTAFSLPMDSRARRFGAKNGVLAVEIAALLLSVEMLLAAPGPLCGPSMHAARRPHVARRRRERRRAVLRLAARVLGRRRTRHHTRQN